MFAYVLLLSTMALATGLALVVAGQDRPRLRMVIDGFTLGAVPTLIATHVLPTLWARLGATSACLVAAGYVTFWLLERAAEQQALRTRVVVTVLGLHSLLDGAALAVSDRLHDGRASSVLIAAIVSHRLPEGVVVGTLLIPRYGVGPAGVAGSLLALLTLAGAVGSRLLLRHADTSSVSVAVAYGMGALLRAVLHGHASPRLQAAPGVLSVAIGAAVAFTVPELW